jgi:hypothetical protein
MRLHRYGDAKSPAEETVLVAEELVCDYIAGVAAKAAESSRLHNKASRGTFKLEDILVCLMKYPKKYARVKDLLHKDEEIRKARQNMKEEEVGEKFKA